MSGTPSLFPDDPPRDAAALAARALSVIDQAVAAGAKWMAPLFSGGHDSFCACHVASRHPLFEGCVHHINTRIGARRTRQYVEDVCREMGWTLNVYESPETYEKFVRERGFPGPGRHHWIYVRIKDRCVRQIVNLLPDKAMLVTGCRSEESERRMGHVEPVKVGEWEESKGRFVNLKRVWTAPCHDWSAAEQVAYMDEHDLPRNPVKLALGMSGECFCGAFAAPGEYERIRHHCPDVADEIDRLAEIARQCGTHAVWGTRPPHDPKGVVVAKTGPLCSSCDRRAYAAGLLFDDCDGADENATDEAA